MKSSIVTWLGVLPLAVVLLPRSGSADTCTIAGTNYPCDFVCTASCTVPSNCATGLGDNVAPCVVCGTASADTITFQGTYTTVVCGKGGADSISGVSGMNNIISGGAGNDSITGGNDDTIYGDDGDDWVNALGGKNEIYGGSGNDVLIAAGGDDFILGGTGDDEILGCGGRDVLKGEDGADLIAADAINGASCPLIFDDVVGSLYCGGAGDDTISAVGPAHQCVDAGANQSGSDCTYTYSADLAGGGERTATSLDVGTARNCASPSGFSSTGERCGCD